MSKSHDVSGQCLCGAIGVQVALTSLDVDACHCTMCRKWSAGPYFALEHEGPLVITGEENLAVYRSSEWAERAFCKVCGTSVFWRLQDSDHYALSAGLFSIALDYRFTKQIFIDQKPDFYEFANATANLTGAQVIAAFAAGAPED